MKAPTGIRFSDEEYAQISGYAATHNMTFSDVVRSAVQNYIYPDKAKGYMSLRDISSLNSNVDLQLVFGQFLDDFEHAQDKNALISEEPVWTEQQAGRWYYDFAAAAHKLADDNKLPVPSWCLKPSYFPEEPFYAFETEDEDFRSYLKTNTPLEFAWHNLFLGPNVLERA